MNPYVMMLETDPDDKDITESMLAEMDNSIPIRFVSGFDDMTEKAVRWGEPAIILLSDLGATRKGNEAIKQVKLNPAYSHIPLIVLGEVSTPDYIKECYRAGANSFIVKPSSIAESRKKIAAFFEYWFEVAEISQ